MTKKATKDFEEFLRMGIQGDSKDSEALEKKVWLGEISLNELIRDPEKSWLEKIQLLSDYIYGCELKKEAKVTLNTTRIIIEKYRAVINSILGCSVKEYSNQLLEGVEVNVTPKNKKELFSLFENVAVTKILGHHFKWEPTFITYFRSQLNLFRSVDSIRQEAILFSFSKDQLLKMTSAKFSSKSHSLNLGVDARLLVALITRYDSYTGIVDYIKDVTKYTKKEIRNQISKMVFDNALEIKSALRIDRRILSRVKDILLEEGLNTRESHLVIYQVVRAFYDWPTLEEYFNKNRHAVMDDEFYVKYVDDKIRNYIV